jgi:repressor LexA
MSDFHIRLKELRLLNNLSQKNLAEQFGVSKSSINMYEHGEREPNFTMLKNIADFFGVDTDYLLGKSSVQNKSYTDNGNIDISRFDNIIPVTTKKIPLIGEIACGQPIFANEEFESYIAIDNGINADYALRCKGDSMTGARIMDGDLVFIRCQPTVENGEIAAVIIDDSATLKRVYIYPDKLILNAENPKYEPLIYVNDELENIHILGKAIAFQSRIK